MSALIDILHACPWALPVIAVVCIFSIREFVLLAFARSAVLSSSKSTILDMQAQQKDSSNHEGSKRKDRQLQVTAVNSGGLTSIGIPLGNVEWNVIRGLVALAFALAGFVMSAPVVGIIAGVLIVAGSQAWLRSKKEGVSTKLEDQVLQLEMQMAENSRAGLSIEKSIRSCLEQSEFPLQGHLDRMLVGITYSNLTLTEAFRDFADRAKSPDVTMLANVVSVQQETGANLADTLDFLSESIAAKHRMRQTLRSRLAEMQLTKIMVSLAPLVILAICCGLISGVAEFYQSNPLGWALLGACTLGDLAGLYLLGKMSRIDID